MDRAPNRWARWQHNAFEIGITAKAAFAAAEALSGIFLLFLNASWVKSTAGWLTASELKEDPGDWLSGQIMAVAQSFSLSTQHFWAAYLIGHGLIKLATVAALFASSRRRPPSGSHALSTQCASESSFLDMARIPK